MIDLNSVAIIVIFLSCSCDCYILKDILQNWSDEDASLILNKLSKVVKKGHRVLVMETILHTGSFAEERVRRYQGHQNITFNPPQSPPHPTVEVSDGPDHDGLQSFTLAPENRGGGVLLDGAGWVCGGPDLPH